MQCGVEQGRVQAERARVSGGVLGQLHLGPDIPAATPGCPQAPEGRAVAVARRGQLRVPAVQRDRDRSRGRPLREAGGVRRLGAGRGQQPAGVPRPRSPAVRVPSPPVDLHRPGVLGTRVAQRHLDLDGALGGQHQGRLEGQFLQPAAAGRAPGPDGQLHERGSGQDRRPGHRVIGQPGLEPRRQPPAEPVSGLAGQLDRRVEQRGGRGGCGQ